MNIKKVTKTQYIKQSTVDWILTVHVCPFESPFLKIPFKRFIVSLVFFRILLLLFVNRLLIVDYAINRD